MSQECRELAKDCWSAILILTHDCVGQVCDHEVPEWLAAAASRLEPTELPEGTSPQGFTS